MEMSGLCLQLRKASLNDFHRIKSRYDAGEDMTLPSTLDMDFGTIAGLIAEFAKAAPDSKALIDGERELSYGELDRLMDAVAAKLVEKKLAAQDVIAICAATSLEYVAVFLG